MFVFNFLMMLVSCLKLLMKFFEFRATSSCFNYSFVLKMSNNDVLV